METAVIPNPEPVLLSIIVVNFNTRDLLKACLGSVYTETKGVEFEVIVVDNNSCDGSQEMLEKEFPRVVKVFNRDNKRWAGGNNQGIKIAKGSIIALLNSDTVVIKDAFAKTIQFMNRFPEASIVGCKLLNPDGSLQTSCKGFPSIWNFFEESFFLYLLFPHSKIFGHYYLNGFKYDRIMPVDMVSGACFMVRRDTFENVGLFDESYYFYGEETDFCFRAKQLGRQTYFFPDAEVIHYGGGSQGNSREHFKILHEGIIHFTQKHYHGFKQICAISLFNLGVVFRVLAYFLIGIVSWNYALIKKSYYFLRILF
jgi:GT2 family glycosyltransferase